MVLYTVRDDDDDDDDDQQMLERRVAWIFMMHMAYL